MEVVDQVMEGLMKRYRERVPDVSGIVNAMVEEGIISDRKEIENDHIAFRTMGVPQLGIRSFEKIFIHLGYERRDSYHFAGKKLDAHWYAPPRNDLPRIFISELRVPDLSPEAQKIITSYTDEVKSDPVDDLDLTNGEAIDEFLHRPLWRTPTWSDYQTLQEESEYAAWVIYNLYYLNHFTITIHNLPEGYNTIETFNAFLEKKGFKLNDAGGKCKVSGDGLLKQSSTVAAMVEAEFSDGKHSISGSYVEFAERRILEEFRDLPADQVERHHRREGFETANADKIFESTYSSQTNK